MKQTGYYFMKIQSLGKKNHIKYYKISDSHLLDKKSIDGRRISEFFIYAKIRASLYHLIESYGKKEKRKNITFSELQEDESYEVFDYGTNEKYYLIPVKVLKNFEKHKTEYYYNIASVLLSQSLELKSLMKFINKDLKVNAAYKRQLKVEKRSFKNAEEMQKHMDIEYNKYEKIVEKKQKAKFIEIKKIGDL